MTTPATRNAFVTARKGICYVTVKANGHNVDLSRIYAYTIDPQEKRDLRRRWPDIAFDWKAITRQLAARREECRAYRSRKRALAADRRRHEDGSLGACYDPRTRTIYADDVPANSGGVAALLDAVLQIDR